MKESIESIEEWIGDTGTLQYGTYYYLFDDFFSLARENARLQMFFALGDVSQKKKDNSSHACIFSVVALH